MQKIVIERPGGLERLRLLEAGDPRPGPGQVRVSVRAAGVNFADVMVRMGYYEAAKGLYPLVPGFEFSGIIDAVGTGVEKFHPGDRVFGITRFGGYASSIAVDARQVWPCPKDWDFPECAAFPAVFLTAYYGLFRAAKVEAGETILVHSAAGGAGGALLQLARLAGCRAVAVVGAAHKAALCEELGAAAVIDRSRQDLWKSARTLVPGGFDAIFDANGVSTLRAGFNALAPGGRLVVYGFAEIFNKGGPSSWGRLAYNYLRVPKFSPLDMTGTNRAVMGYNVVYLFHKIEVARKAMADLLSWIEEGRIKKVPVTLYPFEQAAQAHRAIQSGATVGKLALTMPRS